MDRGYVKLWRKIRSSFLWQDKPFTIGQAWVDLILLANHQDREVFFHQKVESCQRGQIITSILRLSEQWGWSRKKVKGFLDTCQKQHMLRYNIVDKRFIKITICNYFDYQDKISDKGTRDYTTEGTTEGQEKHINKNDKNGKNEKDSALSPGKDSPGKSKDLPPYAEIVDYFNTAIGGGRYKHTTSNTRKNINARWHEGYRLDDFKRVINTKVEEWGNDPKMNKHLCPDTLFGPKMEKYWNQGANEDPEDRAVKKNKERLKKRMEEEGKS
jgi:uncharacterized phage protein (TIGR02220 family)